MPADDRDTAIPSGPAAPSVPETPALKRAREAIAAAVDGNGLLAGQVRPLNSDMQDCLLHGQVRVTLEPKITQTRAPGKQTFGTVLGSQGAVAGAAQGKGQEFLAAPVIQQDIVTQLEQLPVGGWAAADTTLALPGTKADFCVNEPCLTCRGEKNMPCPTCSAQGTVPCTQCQGEGTVFCPDCRGAGQKQNPDGSQSPCVRCQGNGRMPCTLCREKRVIPCPQCQGQKRLPCSDCNQTGWLTHRFTTVQNARLAFSVDTTSLPAAVVELVEREGAAVLAEKYGAHISRGEPVVDQAVLSIPYIAEFPYGRASFSLAGKTVSVEMLGHDGKIIAADPFLDPLVKPGVAALFRLTKGPLAVESLLATASRYRLLREVITGLAHGSKREVYQKVRETYPVGLSDKYARGIITYADRALKLLSRKPRQRGLITGVIASAALYAGWLLTPAHVMAVRALNPPNWQVASLPGLAVFLLGWGLSVWCVKFFAARGYDRILPAALKDARHSGGLPAAGEHAVYALVAALVVFVLLAGQAAPHPPWMSVLLAMVHHG